MANEFDKYRVSLTAPASRAEAVVPSDVSDLARDSRAIYVGGAGDVSFVTTGSDTVTAVAVPAGTMISVMIRRVNATGTTATNILSFS